MSFTITIGCLAGSIESIEYVAARLGVCLSYAKVGGFLCRTYRCVAIGEEDSLRSFRIYLRDIQGVL